MRERERGGRDKRGGGREKGREGGRNVLNAIKDYQWIFSNLFHILHNEHLLRVSCISASRITLGYEDVCMYDYYVSLCMLL